MEIKRKLIDWKGLQKLGVPYSRQHLPRLEKVGRFPPRITIGPNRIVWQYEAVEKWLRDHGVTDQ